MYIMLKLIKLFLFYSFKSKIKFKVQERIRKRRGKWGKGEIRKLHISPMFGIVYLGGAFCMSKIS